MLQRLLLIAALWLMAASAFAAPRVAVATMQPGEVFFERFGHNAIVIADPATGAATPVPLDAFLRRQEKVPWYRKSPFERLDSGAIPGTDRVYVVAKQKDRYARLYLGEADARGKLTPVQPSRPLDFFHGRPRFTADGKYAVVVDDIIREYRGLFDYVRAIKRRRHRVYLSFDEWNVWYRERSGDGDWREAPHLLEEVYNLEDALVCAQYLHAFIRHADVVKIACIAQIVNVIAPVLTRANGILLQSIFPICCFPLSLSVSSSSPSSPSSVKRSRGNLHVSIATSLSLSTQYPKTCLQPILSHMEESIEECGNTSHKEEGRGREGKATDGGQIV